MISGLLWDRWDSRVLPQSYRALGGGWQIREDGYFVDAATNEQMRARTD